MQYFDKPTEYYPVDPEKLQGQVLYRARQMIDWDGNQNPSLSFSLYWLSLVRESYRQASKVHPRSEIKRKTYLNSVYPYGQSIYRNPSRFLRWYLVRNQGVLIGDPTGSYSVPISTFDKELKYVPNPQPNALADNFTLGLLKYYLNPPKVRYVRPNYGYVELRIPGYVSLSKPEELGRKKLNIGTNVVKISGRETHERLKEFIRFEVECYIKQFEKSMDTEYLQYLKSTIGI